MRRIGSEAAAPDCQTCAVLEQHVRGFFSDHVLDIRRWSTGPILTVNPHLRVLRVAPKSAGGLWVYVSVGGWSATADARYGLEFVICAPGPTERAVELLAMNVYYHRGGRLGLGHTVPIGEPWLPGSRCDYYLLSRLYPFGSDLATCHVADRHVDFLWLLPITLEEREFKISHGLEALESRFEEIGLNYWDPHRDSVIARSLD